MPLINRALWFDGLVDDDGSGNVGTLWQKSEVGFLLNSIDTALAAPGYLAAAHAASHTRAGGSDLIPLDALGFPSDNAALNASTTAHGLLPKLAGNTTTFLRADGAWAAPVAALTAHATTHAAGGSDPVPVTTLAGFPGGTTQFLRADGTFATPPGAGAGGGNVNGPASSVVGRVATWNDTTGTSLADGGILLSSLVVTTDPRLTDARTPTAHGATHKAGGSDAIRLDELAAPIDVVTLNVSTTAHGLTPKLPGGTVAYFRGDGAYAVPLVAILSNAQTGVLHNWAPAGLGAGHTHIEWTGNADALITGLAAGLPGQVLTIQNASPTALMLFAHLGPGSVAANRFANLVTSNNTPVAPGGQIAYIYAGALWRLLRHEQGAWILQPYSAADFGATAPMGWAVDAGDVLTYRYRLSGRTLEIDAVILTSTTNGSASYGLFLRIPGSFTGPAAIEYTGVNLAKDTAAAWALGPTVYQPSLSTSFVVLYRPDFGSNWAIGTNSVNVRTHITIEVT